MLLTVAGWCSFAAALPMTALAFSYPALDTTSHWSIQNFGFDAASGFYVQGAGKDVWLGPGQPQTKSAFYSLSVVGVIKDGTPLALQEQNYLGEWESDDFICKYGSFKVAPDLDLVVVLFFMDDGKFESSAYFSGAGYSPENLWDVMFRIDYDMSESGNNIAEFLWSRASEGNAASPPQFPRREAEDGLLAYAAEPGSGASYWAASAHEISIAYPPLERESGQGIENAGFARILDIANPQFGMVLWSSSSTPVEADFKAYASYDGRVDPGADISIPLQYTDESGGLPRYAYAGRDQMLFLKLKPSASGNTYQFGGKLFQRGASRALYVNVHQHPTAQLDGFAFDPDLVLRYTDQGGRTFRNALNELTGEEDMVIARSGQEGMDYLPFDGYAQPGEAITEAQLHNLMTATRAVSTSDLENVREWRMDLYLVDWTLQGEPEAWEAMFDYGSADGNGIAREGAAVFWPALAGQGEDFQRRQSQLSALHAAGLALNMDPSWGLCPFRGYCWNDGSACGGLRCGLSCPEGASGCRYTAYSCAEECADGSVMSLTDVDHSTIRFNQEAAQGSAFSELDWYRHAPEAWIKPGRFGADAVSGPMPQFISP
jgi:hypothetical protein